MTLENVTHQQIVVHRVCCDFRDGLGGHLNVREML